MRCFDGAGVVLVLVAVATAVMGAPRLQAQVPSVRSTRDVILRLENEVPGLMKQGGVPGMSIALIRDGKTIWLQRFGVKDFPPPRGWEATDQSCYAIKLDNCEKPV